MSVPQVGQNAPLGLHVVAPLASTDIIHESTVGDAEPESSRMVLVLLGVGLLGLFALFSNVFGWDSVPVLGDLVPLLGNLGGSGIWYYLIGLMVAAAAIVSTVIGEVLSE
ncbi:MAG: hypothetical protein QF839_00380 [Candidatus Poseidoniaceae archaeon]|jgi:hypothetical protein|nr:hypothetical protein [Candidatus Poseidoniaceae archaeon]